MFVLVQFDENPPLWMVLINPGLSFRLKLLLEVTDHIKVSDQAGSLSPNECRCSSVLLNKHDCFIINSSDLFVLITLTTGTSSPTNDRSVQRLTDGLPDDY